MLNFYIIWFYGLLVVDRLIVNLVIDRDLFSERGKSVVNGIFRSQN